MRIISGSYRGRALVAPPGLSTRPTADRVRQALFDVLAHAPFAPDLHEARVIDLFAGSGALGLEAMSRGAAYCLFVETDEAARGAIRTNLDTLNLLGAKTWMNIEVIHLAGNRQSGIVPTQAEEPKAEPVAASTSVG